MRLALRSCLLAAALAATACSPDRTAPTGVSAEPVLTTALAWSSTTARPGDTVSVRLWLHTASGTGLAGLQGWLRYDAQGLQFAGQPLDGRAIVIVNPAAAGQGRLRLIAVDPQGLETETAELAFVVLRSGYARGARFELEEATTLDLARIRQGGSGADTLLAAPRSAVAPRWLSAADWVQHAGAVLPPAGGPALAPGAGTIYGDATLEGAINVLDVVNIANVSIGLLPLLTPLNRDYVIAANVFPYNLPGLGEAGDPLPPGRETDGSYQLTVSDVVSIANGSVGYTIPVVGQAIPGRTAASGRVVLSGLVAASRTLSSDTVYELLGNVDVQAGVTLTILPGTRIEGDNGSRGSLSVRRGGNLIAQGTRLQPILFTCKDPVPTRGCWGGVVINGLSLLNNGTMSDTGGVFGCPEKPSIGNGGVYGGCLIADTSGVLRYVRIEYAGKAPSGNAPAPGLALLGVGTGTMVDSLQVYGSLGDGLFVSGGTVNVRNVILSNNLLSALHWADGWVGKAQYALIQSDLDNTPGIRGENYAAIPNAQPRSSPQLYNITFAGLDTGTAMAGGGILLESGTAVTLRDAIIAHPGGAGLNIQGPESCALANAATPTLLVENTIFFAGMPNFAADTDCVDEGTYATNPSRNNRVIDPALVAGYFPQSADFRPVLGSPALTGFIVPPADGFFDTYATYLGAVAPVNASSSNIPWYPGWSRGWVPGIP